MSRLYDRIRGFGCEAYSTFHLTTVEDRAKVTASSRERVLAETEGQGMDEAQRRKLADYAGSVQVQLSHDPISTEIFDPTEFGFASSVVYGHGPG